MTKTPLHRCLIASWVLALGTLAPLQAAAADDEAALDLQIDEKPRAPAADAGVAPVSRGPAGRLSVEAAVGALQHRFRDETVSTHRLSIDFRRDWVIGPGLRVGLSDRLDQLTPVDDGDRSTLNSLREAYVSWQQADDNPWAIDLGRLQVRHGPAYGFNPTDFFRRGSLRALTTADPIALRENRLGTVMLRVQKLWADGALSAVLAPKLDDQPSNRSFSLDLGATNHSDRLLLTWSPRLGSQFSGQVLALFERGDRPRLGASGTVLLGESVVGFAEWAGGRQPDALAALVGNRQADRWRNQLSTGATVSLPAQLSITVEFNHNGTAPSAAQWRPVLASTPAVFGPYLSASGFAQDSASRRAWMVYATKRALWTDKTDAALLWRRNQDDGSWFAWVELRHHWRSFDVALQWQAAQGGALTEYGMVSGRRQLQLVGVSYF